MVASRGADVIIHGTIAADPLTTHKPSLWTNQNPVRQLLAVHPAKAKGSRSFATLGERTHLAQTSDLFSSNSSTTKSSDTFVSFFLSFLPEQFDSYPHMRTCARAFACTHDVLLLLLLFQPLPIASYYRSCVQSIDRSIPPTFAGCLFFQHALVTRFVRRCAQVAFLTKPRRHKIFRVPHGFIVETLLGWISSRRTFHANKQRRKRA